MWAKIAEKIADVMALFLRGDTVKGTEARMPLADAHYIEVMIMTSVILFFVFLYLFIGAVYQLKRYGNRIYLKTQIHMYCVAVFCFSASMIIGFRLYNFWYQDLEETIIAYYLFTSCIVITAIILTVLEFGSFGDATKKEMGVIAKQVEEVAEKHGLK